MTCGEQEKYYHMEIDNIYNGKNLICKDFTLEQWRIKDVSKNSKGETKIVKRFEGYILNKTSKINISKPVRIITSKKNMGIEMKDSFPGRSDIESKVDVENIKFNNEFEVYTESPQDAFYVISPYVTEQLLHLKTLCRDFQCVVTNNNIYLAVDTGTLPLQGMIVLKEGQTSKDTEIFRRLSEINKIATDISIYLTGGIIQ